MKRKPVIIVQLIHIQGPLKGEIQEYSESEISIGRHPSCHVHFPKDLAIVSRKHARIVREGNRFKLVDHSTNGTFVNGKKVHEAYLKDGDVLIFAEGGPKVSFLTKRLEGEQETVSVTPLKPPKEPEPYPEIRMAEQAPMVKPRPEPDAGGEISLQKVHVTLVIQYGPTLRSFKELPVTIGKNPNCDLILDHPAILDRHIQIFYSQNQYWVKDLSGRNLVLINQQPVQLRSYLNPNDTLSLSSDGPEFLYLGEGRLAEVKPTTSEDSAKVPKAHEETPPQRISPEKDFRNLLINLKNRLSILKSQLSVLKKLFHH